MDNKTKLRGLVKEIAQDINKDKIVELETKAAAAEEAQAKLFEENKELKTKMDSLQNKQFTLNQNTGSNKYIFKGYNHNDLTKNYRIDCSKEVGDEVAKYMVKALTSANTGAYAVPVEYSNSLLGLAELRSVALSKCRVINVPTTSIKFPVKGTRATVDAQAFGTANAGAATTLGQLTFTIDKRVGDYELVYNDVLTDSNFDVVGEWVEPAMAEAIGQNFDTEVFGTGTEFTTSVGDCTAVVTASGVANIAAAVTFANLNSMYYGFEWERGLNGEWFMARPTMKAVAALVGSTNDHPIFQQTPINGKPSQMLMGAPVNIVATMDDTPDDGAIRMAFGDPSRYIIAVREGLVFQINPYASMKEGITQFIMYARADGNYENVGSFVTMKRSDS